MEQSADVAGIKASLKMLMRMMNAHFGKPVVLLIDEYDVPLAGASEKNTDENRYYEKMLNVIRGLFDAALKTNLRFIHHTQTRCARLV